MKKEKKMTIYYYGILILLLVSLFVALIYYKSDRFELTKVATVHALQKENKESKEELPEETPSSEDLPVDSDLAIELHNKINVFDNIKAGSYYGYFYKQDYLDINSISDDAKVMIGITQNKNFQTDFINATYSAVAPDGVNLDVIILSKEEVKEGINSFFGPNTNYQDTNLIDAESDYCGFSGFKFDETRNVYMNNPLSCNWFPQDYIDSKIIRVYKTGNTIELTLKIAYIKYEAYSQDEVIKYVYRHNNSSNYIEKHDILNDNSYKIDKILNQLDTFKFTFTLNSNNYYYFTKVEKI